VFVLADDKPEIEEGRLLFRLTHNVILFFFKKKGFEKVTCGSIIKLANNVNGYKLHSHSVTYGIFNKAQHTNLLTD
jgi:hypothetical protein